jgi:hypothetical protein
LVILLAVLFTHKPRSRRPRMARKPKPKLNPQVEALRPYLEGVAKKLTHDLFGPDGPPWGTTLTELEDIVLETRAILSKRMLQLSLEQQATIRQQARPAEMQQCPTCQRLFEQPEEPASRSLETRGGVVDWSEPQEYCTRCRRAFFPSKQKSRH